MLLGFRKERISHSCPSLMSLFLVVPVQLICHVIELGNENSVALVKALQTAEISYDYSYSHQRVIQ